jgi:hypothetical protein
VGVNGTQPVNATVHAAAAAIVIGRREFPFLNFMVHLLVYGHQTDDVKQKGDPELLRSSHLYELVTAALPGVKYLSRLKLRAAHYGDVDEMRNFSANPCVSKIHWY